MSTAASKSAVTDALSGYSERGAYPLARLNGDSPAPDSRDGFMMDVTHYANLWFKQPDHNDIEEFLTEFPPFYDWDYLDNKAMWHRNATPVYAAFSAHCLRLIKQWKHETALHRYLSEKPFLATALGFDGIPSQDRLWKDWNRYFSEEDRELIAEAVRDACESHGVHYLMPGRMDASERGTCTDLRRQGKLVHVESQRNLEYYSDGADTSRKEVYVPAVSADWSGDDLDAEPVEEDDDQDESVRQELMSDFAETVDEDRERVGEMFSDVVDEVREAEEQQPTRGSAADARQYQLFKTNHPDIDAPGSDMDEIDTAQMVSGVLRHYRARWGIENGFKQIKSFRVRTTSMDHGYRLFNFLFASTLYNVWRLVDLLVKLELEDDPAHKPLVTADLFLTIAKQCFGLEPPD